MRTEEKTNVKNSIGRLIFVMISVLLQVLWILSMFIWLDEYSAIFNLLFSIATLLLVLRIYGKHEIADFKLPWIILILSFPLLGLCLYLLFGHKDVTKRVRNRFEQIVPKLSAQLQQEPAIIEKLEKIDFSIANQCRYICKYGKFPVFQNTDVEFYAEATDGFQAQLEALSQAEHFIFMEYHAIEEAEAFSRLKAVLEDRAAHGVEVRLFYDDVGSIGFIDPGFVKRMQEIGVQCRVFNPVVPILNFFMNNRDHRKITVIDGKIGFTGGYNLADEYFNLTHPYGYWKDTGIRLTGDAVASLTVMFLEMWNAMDETDVDYTPYFPKSHYTAEEQGFIQLYAGSPLEHEPTSENVYLNLIKSAKHSLYITTPYLIISNEMDRELCLAAKRGVDVRIVTPGIPDKKIIYKVTRSYYGGLAENGVRIYEYTPGFIHAKQVLCDNSIATVGTINFDYRSLYHHFENGAFLYGYKAIQEISKDFQDIFVASTEVTEKYNSGRNTVLRIAQCILRLFAPLL